MRKIHRAALALTVLVGATSIASADDLDRLYYLNQNQTGLSLPGVTMPSGSDEVRASDGTTCKSGLSGNGAYVDMGLIGNQNAGSGTMDNGAIYGRVVVPLGRLKSRVDCTQLYQLEIERLKLEVEAAKLGRVAGTGTVGDAKVGWTNDGDK